MSTIYLDHAATTPLDARVLQAMMPFFGDDYGNASSPHHMGRKSAVATDQWRRVMADVIGCDASEIIFTGSGTESINAAFFGILQNRTQKRIITALTEHKAVLEPAERAAATGYEVVHVALDETGKIHPETLAPLLDEDTALVSLMHANNETGTMHPVGELAELCRKKDIPFHCDAVQTAGKVPLDVQELGVDLLSISAHKFNGPKGTGALYVRSGTPWSAWMLGGSQERGRRAGTLNVPGIAGMGRALQLAAEEMDDRRQRNRRLKKQMMDRLDDAFGRQVRFNGDTEGGLETILSVTFFDPEGMPLDGEMLLLNLDIEGICCSNGSACTSGTIKPSHVIMAMGNSPDTARSTLRFSFGKDNTTAQVDEAVDQLREIISRHTHPAK